MSTMDNAKIEQGKSQPYWLVIPFVLAYGLGIHLGQIVAVASPWPENMGALLASAPFNWRIPGRMGMVLFLALLVMRLSEKTMYQTPTRFLSTLREALRRMNDRHYRAAVGIGIFLLPLIFIAGGRVFAVILIYALAIVAGAFLVNLGIAGRTILGAFWLIIGFVNSDSLAGSWRDIQRDCRPDAQIFLTTGEAYDCTSVQLLTLYSGLIIHHEGRSVFLRASELELWSLEDAAGARAAAAFD